MGDSKAIDTLDATSYFAEKLLKQLEAEITSVKAAELNPRDLSAKRADYEALKREVEQLRAKNEGPLTRPVTHPQSLLLLLALVVVIALWLKI